jgi:hypothetical protein
MRLPRREVPVIMGIEIKVGVDGYWRAKRTGTLGTRKGTKQEAP